jgi:hypothetical protein
VITVRGILYYVDEPRPFELHGLQRLIYDELTTAEAQILMRIPVVRTPGEPLEALEFRGRQFNRHEDNRVLIRNEWGITDVHVANRCHLVTMLVTAEDLAALAEERPDA